MTSSRGFEAGPASVPPPSDALPHVGAVLRHVRHARDLRQLDVVRLSGLSAATVARIEAWGRCTEASFAAYVGALEAAPGPLALRPKQAEFLRQLWDHDRSRSERAALMTAVSAVATAELDATPALADLVAALVAEHRPAVLVDPVYRVLAMNRPMLHLVELTGDEPSLEESATWHVVASCLDARSPFHTHLANHDFVASLVRRFFLHTGPFLFTPQFQRLLARLHGLSPDVFSPLWHQATSLSIPEPLGPRFRVIGSGTDQLLYTASALMVRSIELLPGQSAIYALSVLDPAGAPARGVEPAPTPDRPAAVPIHPRIRTGDSAW